MAGASRGADTRGEMTRTGTERGLAQKLESGQYAIDEHAVAEAMLERLVRGEQPRSTMLVARQASHRGAARVGENSASTGASFA